MNVASSWIVRDRKDDTAVTGCLAQSHESNLSPLRQSFLNDKDVGWTEVSDIPKRRPERCRRQIHLSHQVDAPDRAPAFSFRVAQLGSFDEDRTREVGTRRGLLDAEIFLVLQEVGWISVDAEGAGT